MAASERPDLRFTLITAGVLLALLAAIWAWQRLARPEEVLLEAPLELPPAPSADEAEGALDEEAEPTEEPRGAVRFTPELTVDGPTTLYVELEREPVEGWVGVAVALIHQDTGEVRELGLSSTYQRGARQEHGELTVGALVDRVEGGGWVARLDPAWEPLAQPLPGRRETGEPPAPPGATIRITQGRRSPWQLWVAAGLILVPAVVQIGRRVWYTRRSKTGRE